MSHLTVVVGARPNFMKVAPVMRAIEGAVGTTLVHTGQHYDARMSEVFFGQLGLPEPDVNLDVRSGSHARQTAAVMAAFDDHLADAKTDAVVVVGDVNSTLAAALVAAKRNIPVAHVEAGLRSSDWSMPEEVNRVVTDRLSRWLFTPSADADENLRAEGMDPGRVHLVGNVMIDTLLAHLDAARERGRAVAPEVAGPGPYGVATLHRPANVDDPSRLARLLDALAAATPDLRIVFPTHPRTAARMEDAGYAVPENIRCLEPLPYLDFLGLVAGAAVVVTDSGGIQEETSVLGVPCLTVRDNTERPVTCALGTNTLVGTDPTRLGPAVRDALAATWAPAEIPLWDGHAGERIAEVLLDGLD